MHINLENKNILVTGGSRGIGEAIARHLGHSSARVAVHYLSSKKQAEQIANSIGNNSFAIQADLNNPDEVFRLFSRVLDQMNKLDVLVNNAGIAIKSPIKKDDSDWTSDLMATLNTNLVSATILSKMAINHFMLKDGGIIINICSRAAFRGENQDYLAYAVSKGGMVSLTRTIAKEFGKKGITAFNIAPGFVLTDMAQQFIDEFGEDMIKDQLALNDITRPDDLGPLIVLLASGLAKHSTGTTIDVNAGSYMH